MRKLFFLLFAILLATSAKAQGDLGTFFLCGPVKTVIENDVVDGENVVRMYSFNRNGRLVAFHETGADKVREKIFRKNGRIVQIGITGYAMDMRDLYEYKPSGGVGAYSSANAHTILKETFTDFNKYGLPVAADIYIMEGFLNYSGEGTGQLTYTYLDVDSNGNWTKLVKKGSYEETGYDEDGEMSIVTVYVDKVITREIHIIKKMKEYCIKNE